MRLLTRVYGMTHATLISIAWAIMFIYFKNDAYYDEEACKFGYDMSFW